MPPQSGVPVAQLDRALPSEGKGCGFNSRRAYQFFAAFWRQGTAPYQGGLSRLRLFGTSRQAFQQSCRRPSPSRLSPCFSPCQECQVSRWRQRQQEPAVVEEDCG